MRQLGCCRACSTVISAKRSFGSVRKGPPEAVKMSRSTASRRSPMRHCSTALCSLSMGRMGTPARRAASVTTAPALTSTSLLARAMGIPACSAAKVGRIPCAPTSATTTRSFSGSAAASCSPSMPQRMRPRKALSCRNLWHACASPMTTPTGWKRSTCCASSSMLVFVAR
jgi:hypothetical protein